MNNKREHIKKEILKELEDLNSSLIHRMGDNSYGLPSNYFERLEHEVMQSLIEKSPYKVEDAYFKNLADTIQNRIKTENNTSVPRIKKMHIISGIAASIMLVSTIFLLLPTTDQHFSHSLAEAELFLDENIADLDLEDMIELEMIESNELIDLDVISTEEMESYIEENINAFNIEELSDFL